MQMNIQLKSFIVAAYRVNRNIRLFIAVHYLKIKWQCVSFRCYYGLAAYFVEFNRRFNPTNHVHSLNAIIASAIALYLD